LQHSERNEVGHHFTVLLEHRQSYLSDNFLCKCFGQQVDAFIVGETTIDQLEFLFFDLHGRGGLLSCSVFNHITHGKCCAEQVEEPFHAELVEVIDLFKVSDSEVKSSRTVGHNSELRSTLFQVLVRTRYLSELVCYQFSSFPGLFKLAQNTVVF
jgi:hypothetical protein